MMPGLVAVFVGTNFSDEFQIMVSKVGKSFGRDTALDDLEYAFEFKTADVRRGSRGDRKWIKAFRSQHGPVGCQGGGQSRVELTDTQTPSVTAEL